MKTWLLIIISQTSLQVLPRLYLAPCSDTKKRGGNPLEQTTHKTPAVRPRRLTSLWSFLTFAERHLPHARSSYTFSLLQRLLDTITRHPLEHMHRDAIQKERSSSHIIFIQYLHSTTQATSAITRLMILSESHLLSSLVSLLQSFYRRSIVHRPKRNGSS